MMTTLTDALAAIPYFASVPPERISEVEALCAIRSCSPGESIFVYGDTGDALYLIAEGEVEVFTNNNAGKEIPLELMSAGAVFGEVALFNGETRTANAKASGETVLVRIARQDVSAALSLCPELRDALLSGMARRLRVSGENLRHLTTFDINAMKHEQLTSFDHFCARVVDVLAGVPFLVALIAAFTYWCVFKPFHDSSLSSLSLTISAIGLLITLLVLLNQNRQEKSAIIVDAEESLAIRQAAKELQFLHEKLDAVLSRTSE